MRRRSLTIPAVSAILLASAVHGVALTAAGDDPGRRRPQEPTGLRPYAERQVAFESAPGVRLAGTLTLPAERGPHPAVVLVGGTGAQDRDASIAGHRPFLVLADHLARQGIAVLRFDERGVGASSGRHDAATTLDFADDVTAAVSWLAAQAGVDARRIGVIGHSEGGMVAPLVATRTAAVAFLVLLAAPGVPMREIGVRQAEAVARAEGVPEADVAARVKLSSSILALFAEELDEPTLKRRARPILDEGFAGIPLTPRMRAQQIELALAHYASPWAQFALRYDPAPALRRVRVPVLALHGALDVQIDAATNLAAITSALRAGGNPHVTAHALPGLNHLFQSARTGGLGEYAAIEETFSPAALRLVSEWVQTVSSSSSSSSS
jgi:uncharacterized protein